jgi:hypothetical protein
VWKTPHVYRSKFRNFCCEKRERHLFVVVLRCLHCRYQGNERPRQQTSRQWSTAKPSACESVRLPDARLDSVSTATSRRSPAEESSTFQVSRKCRSRAQSNALRRRLLRNFLRTTSVWKMDCCLAVRWEPGSMVVVLERALLGKRIVGPIRFNWTYLERE